jgi:hypothetical protein
MLFLPSIRPQFTVDLREWYVAEYKEPLFVHPPAWLQVVFGLGGCLLNPRLSCGPVLALLRNDPLTPLDLLD